MVKDKFRWYDKIGNEYETIEALNSLGERVWIKFMPITTSQPVKVVNILDKPNEVSWQIRDSHTQVAHPNGSKYDYDSVLVAGSTSSTTNVLNFNTTKDAEIITFPLENSNPQIPLTHSTCTSGITVTVETNQPCWIGYVVLRGKIKSIEEA